MEAQAAIFYRDGSIKVIKTEDLQREIETFNQLFADDLKDAFKVIVNGGSYTYPYNVIDGKARL